MSHTPDHQSEKNLKHLFEPIIVDSFGEDRILKTDVDALFKKAKVVHSQDHLNEAESLYRKVLSLDPDHHGAIHFLGVVALAQKKFPESLRLIERSLQFEVSSAIYFNNHGVVLKELGRFEEAETAFQNAINLRPNYVDALSNLGMIGLQLDRPSEKVERYLVTALQHQPNHCDALSHLITLYSRQKKFHEVIPYLEHIVEMEPNHLEYRHWLGCMYGECGRIENSKEQFQFAASLRDTPQIWKWKHLRYSPAYFENEKEIDYYWNRLNIDLDEAIAEKPLYDWRTLPYDGFTHSFHLPHYNKCCRDVLEKYAELFISSFPFERPNYRPDKKIKVGFLVTPGHEGGFLRLTSGIIENINPERFEPIVIYNETAEKRFENRFQRPDLVRVPYSWNFENAVQTIKDAKCDVIYYWKAAGDPWSFFLPMCYLAPIQCTSWSTHGTSGLEQIDYYVSWDKAETPNAQGHYTEKLHLLNTTPLYEPKLTNIPAPASRKELQLPSEVAIYFCPHRPSKYHPIFDDYLRKILERDPNGHIILLSGKSLFTANCIIERMKKNIGEEYFKRMIFLPQLDAQDYYRYISVSTVILNSPVYSGEITAIDGFLYGVPCVTLTGELLVHRYATAFYEFFGIDGPAVITKEEYVEQAVKLGTDKDYRNEISHKIMENHDRFFENMETVREWERFIEDALKERACENSNMAALNHKPIHLNNLELNVAYGCNMKCNYCTHFSGMMSGLENSESLRRWSRTWHQKLSPKTIRIIGGEPLLHPELIVIMKETKEYWPDSRIDLVTNGLLLPKHPEVLELLKEIDGYVFISRHSLDEEYLARFDLAMKLLKDSGIGFTLYTSERQWRKCYLLDENKRPIPFHSNHELAWKNCRTKNFCPTLLNNKIYKCQHLAHAALGVEKGILPDSWKVALKYKPLEPNCSREEIGRHLNSDAIPECGICPEQYEFASPEEKFKV